MGSSEAGLDGGIGGLYYMEDDMAGDMGDDDMGDDIEDDMGDDMGDDMRQQIPIFSGEPNFS
jgi:hypothetical protein